MVRKNLLPSANVYQNENKQINKCIKKSGRVNVIIQRVCTESTKITSKVDTRVSRVSFSGLLLCNQCTDGKGNPATVHSSRTF